MLWHLSVYMRCQQDSKWTLCTLESKAEAATPPVSHEIGIFDYNQDLSRVNLSSRWFSTVTRR